MIQTFNIHNRKYIGSKYRLIQFIEHKILTNVKNIDIFIDGFSGTGVVAHHFRKFSKQIIANDILYSNYVINKTFLNSKKETVHINKIIDLLDVLNNLHPQKGYAYNNYGGTYFTPENAGLIDSIRETIKNLYRKSECTLQEKYILITSLLFAVDKVANTVGQYDAFLKHIGKATFDKKGVHKVDSNVYKRIHMQMPEIVFDGKNEVYNEDLNELIIRIDGTILYLDPPYNSRQYVDNYHVLENIAKWEKPLLYGKTKKFTRDNLKSKYSRKTNASEIFIELINRAKVEHIFLSYNNEGIIPDEIIVQTLKNRGKTEVFEADYIIFGNGAGKSKRRKIIERLFYCKVRK